MAEYRAGIIGCGNMGHVHARAYAASGRARVAAGAEPREENRHRFQNAFPGAAVFSDFREMLAKAELDVLSVTTWPSAHAEAVSAAAEAGVRGILSEKPMATNLEEADRMIEACLRRGVTFGVSHQHRWDPQSVRAREMLERGAIGRLLTVYGHCCLDLLNNGTHVVDLIHYFNHDEPVRWVMGQIDIRRHLRGRGNHPDMPVEDMAIGRMQYANGVLAHFELGELADPAYHFRLVGTEGMMDVNLPGHPALRLLSSRAGGWQSPELPQLHAPHESVIRELLAAMEEHRPHASSGQVARSALEVLVAVFESSRRRALIDFPVSARDLPLLELFGNKS
ncbi:MAG: Gfo/Idh/MocA family oxidoreductase [Planctomycetes bacterium]|nr:Gfo/Idh/MocA family oxidoreductase [Planctomycetota bacterium]